MSERQSGINFERILYEEILFVMVDTNTNAHRWNRDVKPLFSEYAGVDNYSFKRHFGSIDYTIFHKKWRTIDFKINCMHSDSIFDSVFAIL